MRSGLSNMARGFALVVNGVQIPTAEALYQAMRFPGETDLQSMIIEQSSPMGAKMISKSFRKRSLGRPDWDGVRVDVMRWVLQIKLACHLEHFVSLLASTGTRQIVEDLGRRPATADSVFWGAKPISDCQLLGTNTLGRLLSELRDLVRARGIDAFRVVAPPDIDNFTLCRVEITTMRS